MKINFFDQGCNTAISANEFGICDDHLQAAAYITTDQQMKWGAHIVNPEGREILFVAIDNCIEIKRPNGEMERRCDAMLSYDRNIDFVELKDVKANWIEDGAGQLLATVSIFSKFHDLKQYRRKRAFICNRQHRRFRPTNLETKQRFEYTFNMRVFAQHQITV